MNLQTLRKKYPNFTYKSFAYKIFRNVLKISFDFIVPPDIQFRPVVVIKRVGLPAEVPQRGTKAGERALNNLAFNLGLVEMISYWKATCSPKIIIEAGYLSKQQIAWWKDLIFKGMGEFFYKNKIDFTKSDFLAIKAFQNSKLGLAKFNLAKPSLKPRILIPVGGGKDAVVTLELLKKMPHRSFILNPKQEHKAILKVAGEKNPVIVERVIDPKLLELNQRGFLNGHTPFSAYLAFLSVFVAVLFDYKYIALSNERSSNEGNVKYLGKTINHQYSKTYEFEKKFREYSKKYLAKNVEYFSFLRPLYELQIAKIFSEYPKYFGAFLSCNEANKTKSGTKKPTGKWCGKCAKCLFVWIILRPFVKEKQLVFIFKKNLLEDRTLKPLLDELTGRKRFKPFECVGTIKESIAALSLCFQKQEGKVPRNPILSSWNEKNFIPRNLAKILQI